MPMLVEIVRSRSSSTSARLKQGNSFSAMICASLACRLLGIYK
jgi:hypothetical protein